MVAGHLQYVQDMVLQVVVVAGPLHEVVLQVVVAGPSSADELVAEAADELVAELVAAGSWQYEMLWISPRLRSLGAVCVCLCKNMRPR